MDIRHHPSMALYPDWANFVAMDKNGMVFIYQYEPIMHSTYWMGARLKSICWAGMPWWSPSNNDWQQSIQPLRNRIDPKYLREDSKFIHLSKKEP